MKVFGLVASGKSSGSHICCVDITVDDFFGIFAPVIQEVRQASKFEATEVRADQAVARRHREQFPALFAVWRTGCGHLGQVWPEVAGTTSDRAIRIDGVAQQPIARRLRFVFGEFHPGAVAFRQHANTFLHQETVCQLLGFWIWQCVEDGLVNLGITGRA